MTFAHPAWLLAGLLACGTLIAVWRRYDVRQRAELERFLAPHLRAELTESISRARRTGKRLLFAAAIALLFIALAGPQAGFQFEEIQRRGNDIVFAIDTSRSMDSPDVKPTRLERAKLAVGDLVDHLNGDAVGLVAFAGSAFLQTPITLDYGAFHESLAALDTHIIPRGGTNIASAIRATQAALHDRPGSDKVLILLTDGEDLEGDALAAARTASRQDGLKIFTVGVGTANGELIPLPADQGGGFLKDRDGNFVRSRLDEAALKSLAAATGGTYAPLGAANQGLESIYREALAPLAKHDLQARAQKVYTERYQWPLGAALALLLASLMIGTRRRGTRRIAPVVQPATPAGQPGRGLASAFSRAPAAAGPVAVLAATWLAGSLLPVQTAHAAPTAVAAYDAGQFTAAERAFAKAAQEHPNQPLWQFNTGDAAYKAGDYAHAAQAFEASVNAAKSGSARRLADQEDAYYNLGNTLYREGQTTRQNDRQTTIATWTRAVKAYDAALELRADDADSKFNRDLVQRQLDALKQQPPPQDQSKSASSQPKSAKNQSQGQPSPSKPQQQPGKSQSPSSQQPDQSTQSGHSSQQAQAQQQTGQSPRQAQAQQPGQPPQQGPGSDQKASGASASQTMAQAGDDQRQPGEMSRAEARELLDSVKNEQHGLPATPLAQSNPDSPSNDPLKDW
jgi:Ca-activated chloride channel family protein